ncbi:MAG TPA: zf-HC2 domain-containing protein [Anaeromyxobacteraceae bacterium]
MMTCKQITELVTAYAEGQLGLMDRIRFRLHIGMCRHCRRYVRQLKATAKALGKLPDPEIPPDLEAELLRRFEGWKASRQPPAVP